jgi:hypothetical protein
MAFKPFQKQAAGHNSQGQTIGKAPAIAPVTMGNKAAKPTVGHDAKGQTFGMKKAVSNVSAKSPRAMTNSGHKSVGGPPTQGQGSPAHGPGAMDVQSGMEENPPAMESY